MLQDPSYHNCNLRLFLPAWSTHFVIHVSLLLTSDGREERNSQLKLVGNDPARTLLSLCSLDACLKEQLWRVDGKKS